MAAATAPPKVKVIYFNYDGGRGETIRLALHLAGVEFIDERIDFPNWPQLKPKTPYGTLPLLEWEGVTMAQSNSILRFIGRKFSLYPADLIEAQRADEIMDAVEDLAHKIAPTMSIPAGPERLAKRKEIAEGTMKTILTTLEALHQKHRGQSFFYCGEQLSVVDLKVYGLLRWLCSGVLDGIDASFVQSYKSLMDLKNGVDGLPAVAKFMANRKGGRPC